MSEKKKAVEAITSMSEDFTQWYTDICLKAELVDYSTVKGCIIMRPYGYAIWENITKILDARFKATGHENVAMPMLIPEGLLQKEKDHVEGFAPEVAWVTMGGSDNLDEKMCVRPTSETLFCDHWSNVLQSYRQLPMKYNQWCSVMRWEKTTRPFLRTREFWWQEGHTIHETEQEAIDETVAQLETYADFVENDLNIPVLKGEKTPKEKFAGAHATYSIEAMMHDGKALQSATSHYFGDGFSKAFDVTFTGRDNKLQHPYQTSWGLSTRIIGAIIMAHGDDNGLILPAAIAPVQVVVIPIASHKPGVLDKVSEIEKQLGKFLRVKCDTSDNSPGWKFAQWEMKGVPIRLEIGPRDIENNSCVLVRRDTGEKITANLDNLTQTIQSLLNDIGKNMYKRASENRTQRTYCFTSMQDAMQKAESENCYIKTMWCGSLECEEMMKEKAGLTSRCIPFEQEKIDDNCICCNKPATKMVVWGKAY